MSQPEQSPPGRHLGERAEGEVRPFPDLAPEELVAHICHHLRNPLATIQSGIQLVQVLAAPTGEAADCLEVALAEVQRIEAVLRDLQRLVRLTAGPPRLVDVAALVLEVAAPREARGAGIASEGPGDMAVAGDPELLRLALDALLARAVAVTPGGGRVVVRWCSLETTTLAIEVDDDGDTASAGSAPRVIRPLDAPGIESGLGLCTASRACTLLGGRLEWAALLPRGSRFRMVLPRG